MYEEDRGIELYRATPPSDRVYPDYAKGEEESYDLFNSISHLETPIARQYDLLFKFDEPKQLVPNEKSSIAPEPVFNIFTFKKTTRKGNKQKEDIYSTQQSAHTLVDNTRIGPLTYWQRREKVLRYQSKKSRRHAPKKTYVCRQMAAIHRPRYRGRFIRVNSTASESISASTTGQIAKCGTQENAPKFLISDTKTGM